MNKNRNTATLWIVSFIISFGLNAISLFKSEILMFVVGLQAALLLAFLLYKRHEISSTFTFKYNNLSQQDEYSSAKKKKRLISELSEREKEVWKLLANGKTDKEIADELFISTSTVNSHIHKLYTKLKLRNRIEATRLYMLLKELSELENSQTG